ncbi:deoxyribodipyrimidine photo-lyase [Grimontia hollisae]|uniref:Deoxyribodipyrimidine photo-lyase n=1 Tax=Grimontia hollisae CIP 101886 TaxID=675812 RepID=D0I5K2_GRIHO|nr:deoxyribodipyrimidine photo-lyase [Grimontia hollisae]AMG29223.1 deoxyribodipyrimidine photo-lyase [Grimontia hollisae]EEY73166.1 deoxyribodipyrimidine photolyase [Grimontia hollisae CIP 101886]MDF2184907.1 deoxyribodipyrimidine photo-lyase [Grimontia hollisae]STO76646.1 Deoxyribodipyrimidine photo-lyase [Grimontia hollisae]
MKLVWFRRDLRVKDNVALTEACKSGEPVIAIYYETPVQWKAHALAPMQADLIQRRLVTLRQELETLNIPLLFRSVDRYKDINQSLAQLCQQYQIADIFCTRDYETDEVDRDNAIAGMLSLTGTTLHRFDYKCIFAPGMVTNGAGNTYRVFTPFKKAWITQATQLDLSPIGAPSPVKTDALTSALLRQPCQIAFRYPQCDSVGWPIDDSAIIQRLRDFCRYRVDHYQATRDFPAIPGTSQLSPYLAIGAISPRQCLARLLAEVPNCMEKDAGGAHVWLSELIWREFYQHIAAAYIDVSKGKAFQDWTDNIEWNRDELQFQRWKQGKTGFPIVDAAMRQLNDTGWMHNRLRMIVASFLVKDLHIDWRWGERYFMSKLIDGDFAANNGGWQWSASTGTDAQPYFRVFNPASQSKKFDPNVRFIRRWLKELESVPDSALHTPHIWAEKKGIELSYPAPIVDHKTARISAIEMFEMAKNYQSTQRAEP